MVNLENYFLVIFIMDEIKSIRDKSLLGLVRHVDILMLKKIHYK